MNYTLSMKPLWLSPPPKPVRSTLRRNQARQQSTDSDAGTQTVTVVKNDAGFVVTGRRAYRRATLLRADQEFRASKMVDAVSKKEITTGPTVRIYSHSPKAFAPSIGSEREFVTKVKVPTTDAITEQFYLPMHVPSVDLTEDVIDDFLRFARTARRSTFQAKLKNLLVECLEKACIQKDQVSPLVSQVEQQIADPLATARQRGAQYAVNEWKKPENLSLQAAADYAGLSDGTINMRRQRQQLYALVAPGKTRGFRYPKWQFDVASDRLSEVLTAFLATGQKNSWVLHSFMMRPCHELEGARPSDYIAHPSNDIKRLVQVIQRRFSGGDQGAA